MEIYPASTLSPGGGDIGFTGNHLGARPSASTDPDRCFSATRNRSPAS